MSFIVTKTTHVPHLTPPRRNATPPALTAGRANDNGRCKLAFLLQLDTCMYRFLFSCAFALSSSPAILGPNNPIRHPTEPTCTYDPIEGLHPAPDTVENPVEKVKVLETQIGTFEMAAALRRLVFLMVLFS